jgi:hypothetical protein
VALEGEGAAPVDAGPWVGAALHPLLETRARLHVRVQFMRVEPFPALPARRKTRQKSIKLHIELHRRLQILVVFTYATLVFCLFRRSSLRTTVARPWKTKPHQL